MCDLVLTRSQ